jgi:hypothetical protein
MNMECSVNKVRESIYKMLASYWQPAGEFMPVLFFNKERSEEINKLTKHAYKGTD